MALLNQRWLVSGLFLSSLLVGFAIWPAPAQSQAEDKGSAGITESTAKISSIESQQGLTTQEEAAQRRKAIAKTEAQIVQLKKRIGELSKDNGETSPGVLQAQGFLLARQQELLELVERDRVTTRNADRLPADPGRNSQALLSDEANAAATIRSLDSTADDPRMRQAAAVMQLELTEVVEQLSQREQQVAQLSEQLARLERNQASLPIEGTETKVFSLRHVKAPEASGTLESLFGSHLRVAIDERSNSLIVIGKADTLKVVEAILLRLDQSEDVAEGYGLASPPAASAPRPLMLRVFWLADGMGPDEGRAPSSFLPRSVLDAIEKLGLKSNTLGIVAQTVNSLAVGDNAPVEFSARVPAILLKQPVELIGSGQLNPVVKDVAGLRMGITVTGPGINCELSGSLSTPLGHYMVLGTANSVIADPATMAGMGMMGGRMRGGYGGYGGRGRGGEGGYGAESGEMEMGEGAVADGQPPAEPKYDTSRFAFVVQVIEGESFPAEE